MTAPANQKSRLTILVADILTQPDEDVDRIRDELQAVILVLDAELLARKLGIKKPGPWKPGARQD